MSKYTGLAMERCSHFIPEGGPAWNCCQAVVSVFAEDARYDIGVPSGTRLSIASSRISNEVKSMASYTFEGYSFSTVYRISISQLSR